MKKLYFSLVVLFLFAACKTPNLISPTGESFKEEMRLFVIGLSDYARTSDADFIIIPQNGIELITEKGEDDAALESDYLAAIDGHGQEDLFYGYKQDDRATSNVDVEYLRTFLDRSRDAGKTILVTDYCSTPSKMNDAYSKNNNADYVSFSADHRGLDNIPSYPVTIYGENDAVITQLSQIKNFLYLIDPTNYTTKTEFITAVTATNYDLLLMDLFFQDGSEFTAAEVEQLKRKANGGQRLLVCYMSIGESEDYRYYWDAAWDTHKPSWIGAENSDWEGNFHVKYWNAEWQNIIYGNDSSYLKKILNAGFDGVYLDIIDAFDYFE